jgi:hypothetical protein
MAIEAIYRRPSTSKPALGTRSIYGAAIWMRSFRQSG